MKYKIAISWQECGEIEVEADNLEQALEIAQNDEGIDLPVGTYIDASWKVDEEMSKYLNE